METLRNRRGNRRGLHPNSLKNLRAGQGRPRNEESITHIQRQMLPQICPYDSKGRTWAEWLAERGMALAGENAAYFRELMDRLEGKVVQSVMGQLNTDIVFTIGKGYSERVSLGQEEKEDGDELHLSFTSEG